MHPSDGNTYAINRHLAEQEAYDAAQQEADMYCAHCDEAICGDLDALAIAMRKCPNCSEELDELP
jgi:hypothetical protein